MKIPIYFFLLLIVTVIHPICFCDDSSPAPIRPRDFFSSDYQEARKKFLDAAASVAGASIESYRHPNNGPDGKPLYMDVVVVGNPNEADFVLVICSGTHGVEGFAGSGIQTGLLNEGISSSLHGSNNISLVFIHAINPFGFAHLRRFNEDNVDINRNFVDHSKPYPINFGYAELGKIIDPLSISMWPNVKAIPKLAYYISKNGYQKAKEAISGGQYTNPEGIFFGGNEPCWSSQTLQKISSKYLGNANRVVVIDFHTGLGDFGETEVIMNEKVGSPAYIRAMLLWDGERKEDSSEKAYRVATTSQRESVSVHLTGSLKLAWSKWIPQESEVTAVSVEFGTLSRLDVFLALRNENWLFNHGSNLEKKEAEVIRAKLLWAFYPCTNEWISRIWKSGTSVVYKALETGRDLQSLRFENVIDPSIREDL